MNALILNSGLGSRMGELTKRQPKCMTEISSGETILSRQLHGLMLVGVQDVVITTGAQFALRFHGEGKAGHRAGGHERTLSHD